MEPRVGFGPTACCLQNSYSTTELPRPTLIVPKNAPRWRRWRGFSPDESRWVASSDAHRYRRAGLPKASSVEEKFLSPRRAFRRANIVYYPMTKDQIIESITQDLDKSSLRIVGQDLDRPWGGYLLIDEAQIDEFIDKFFPGDRGRINDNGAKLSPKILLIAPHTRLSWQYHNRRQELWKVVAGPVAAALSHTDDQPQTPQAFNTGDVIAVGRTQRHRLIGNSNWGVVAEIWSHTDPSKPSTEDDIVRLQDDFGRASPK